MTSHQEHSYAVQVTWTGNTGDGTSHYRAYSRDHEISAAGKPSIPGSADPAFRGDRTRYNPEDLLVASLSACHMLWYLHLCAGAGIRVIEYSDDASGTMAESAGGSGRFTSVCLRPTAVLDAGSDPALASALHARAHEMCFVANSVNFPVHCDPIIRIAAEH